MSVESSLHNLGLLTVSKLVRVSDLKKTYYKEYREVTARSGESAMLDGEQIVVPRGFRKITYRGKENNF